MLELVISEPNGAKRRMSLSPSTPSFLIGRDPSAFVVLDSAKISRRHAQLIWRDTALWLEDLGSVNGVLVDGVLVEAPTPLSPSSVVEISGFGLSIANAQDEAHPSDAPPMFVLRHTSGAQSGEVVRLELGETIVGRSSGATVQIEDASLSRRHARFVVAQEHGTLRLSVRDLKSSNGTFVAGVPISDDHDVPPGSVVQLGSVSFLAERVGMAVSRANLPHIGRRFAALTTFASKVLVVLGVLGVLALGIRVGQKFDVGRRIARIASPQRLAHVKERLLGLGPSAAEKLWQSDVKTSLAAADEQLSRHALDEAMASLQRAIKLDPTNEAATALLVRTEAEQRRHEALGLARAQMDAGATAAALALVSSAVAEQAHVVENPNAPPEAPSDPSLLKIADAALAEMGKVCVDEAKTACVNQQWAVCMQQAICAKALLKESDEGGALLAWAQDALPQPVKGTGLSDAWVESQLRLRQFYAMPELRRTMLVYGLGDVVAAQKQAQTLGCPRCRAVAQDMQHILALAQKQDEALGLNDGAAATAAMQQALAIDARLLPQGQPSVLGHNLRHKAQDTYLKMGEAAFSRGSYAEALTAWQQGQAIESDHPGLTNALERLHTRALALLKGVGSPVGQAPPANPNHGTKDACQPLREVLAMTASDDPLHGLAAEKLAQCRGGHIRSARPGALGPAGSKKGTQ